MWNLFQSSGENETTFGFRLGLVHRNFAVLNHLLALSEPQPNSKPSRIVMNHFPTATATETAEETHLEEVDLTILMPCLNEAETLEVCIEKAKRGMEEAGVSGEVLIADNGSTDGSQELAKKLGARVVHVEAKGYGNALRGGIAAAKGKWVIMGDADDSYDFSSIAGFVEKLKEGNDLVMGCRMPRGGGTIMPGAMPWKHRWIGNPVLSLIGKIFFKSKVDDFHCGLRGFSRKAIVDLNLKTTGMEFASEMVIRSTIEDLKIAQIPITLHPDGRSRPPHLRSWRDGWRHLRFMLLYCPKWLFLYPGIFMIVAGVLGSAWLISGPKTLGSIELDIHTLAYFLFSIVVGTQIVCFARLTRSLAMQQGIFPDERVPVSERPWLVSLEGGLIASLILMTAGLAGSLWAVFGWGQSGFGDIEPSDSMRIVLPSILLFVLGVQFFFNSFFFSVIDLARRE